MAFAQTATGNAAPITAASEMRRRWCMKNLGGGRAQRSVDPCGV